MAENFARPRAAHASFVYAGRLALAIAAALAFALAVAAFAVPAVVSMSSAFGGPGSGSAPAVSAAAEGPFFDGRIFSALRFTLTEAILSSLAAVMLGLPAAFLVARRQFPGRRFLLALSGVPLCVPPVIIALAFVLFYGRQGYLNVFLMRAFHLSEPPVTFLYSLSGVVIAHGFYNFPVVLRTVAQVWERLPAAEEEAAVLLGAGKFRVFRTVTLPRLSGAILSSAVLVFLYCFFSFVIVLLFGGIGGTTLEVELYQAARASFDFRLAGTIALFETAIALGVVALYMRFQNRLSSGTAGLSAARARKNIRGAGETAALAAYLAFIVIFFLGPLFSIALRSLTSASGPFGKVRFGFGSWATLFSRPAFAKSFASTALTGLAVAVFASAAALFFALLEENSRCRAVGIPLRVLPLAPLAVSSVVLGFGWMLLVPRGNVAVLVLAQTAISWPFAWTQIRTSLDRIPRSVHDAALVLSAGKMDRSFRVFIPLAARGILSGAGFAFAISAGDASLPLVLSLDDFENLSLMLYRLVGSYRFSEACACAVVLAALSGFVFFLEDGKSRDSSSERKSSRQRNFEESL
jgi:thiamine transport system permease protein